MHQAKLIFIPALLAIAIFLGVDYFGRAVERPQPQGIIPEVAYNSYSEGINSVHFDEQGKIRYTMRANRQVSYLDAETSIENPHIELYREDNSRWNIVARSGRISAGSVNSAELEEIVLNGGVEVYQMDKFGNRTLLASETLIFDPSSDLLTTSDAVTLVSDTLEQTAIGMRLDVSIDEYVFNREVRGRYAAPQN